MNTAATNVAVEVAEVNEFSPLALALKSVKPELDKIVRVEEVAPPAVVAVTPDASDAAFEKARQELMAEIIAGTPSLELSSATNVAANAASEELKAAILAEEQILGHSSPAANKVQHEKKGRGKRRGEKVRTQHIGGGIRRLDASQLEQSAPVRQPPPSGSISLNAFLNKFPNSAALAYHADELAKAGTPADVVVWSRSNSGFDYVRIGVVVTEGKRRDGSPTLRAHLCVTEATGKFEESLSSHVGKTLFCDEVLGRSAKSISADRAPATMALNAVLVEADEILKKAIARKKAGAAEK